MRLLCLVFAATVAAFASSAHAQFGGANPFPVERGSALPPPGEARANRAAPPQGPGPGGIDFGAWRGAEPEAYGRQFQTQLRGRFAGQGEAQIRADLEANGFVCETQARGRLHCRFEIMESQCAVDWYAVIERPGEPAIAGFDRMCLPAP